MADVETHQGSCHCGAVAFEVDMSLDGLIECNCSHCYRKGFVLGFVQPDAFRLTADGPQSEYRFGSHKIGHRFCQTCGVQSFAQGEAPDGRPMVSKAGAFGDDDVLLRIVTELGLCSPA